MQSLLNSGEPRPLLVEYVLKYYGDKCMYFAEDVTANTFLLFKCGRDNVKDIVKPSLKLTNEFKERLLYFNPKDKPLVLFHVVVQSKSKCVDGDKHRHGLVIVYNRLTNKVFKYNILRFHAPGFSTKNIGKRLPLTFIPWLKECIPKRQNKSLEIKDSEYYAVFDDAYTKLKEYLEKESLSTLLERDIYPLFILWEIDTITKYPGKKQEQILKKMLNENHTKFESVIKLLQFRFRTFLNVFYKQNNKCSTGSFIAPETNRCVKASSPSGQKLLGVKKMCAKDKFYNIITRRCNKGSSKFVIDLNTKRSYSRKSNLKLGSSKGQIYTLMYFANKFPDAAFFLPKQLSVENIEKKDYQIRWEFDNISKKWKLQFPKGFKTFWKNSMYDKNVKNIVTLLGLRSIVEEDGHVGYHLNTLIYNKKTSELQHFEPHGIDLSNTRYNTSVFYKTLKQKIEKLLGKAIKYLPPSQVCPIGFQSIEGDEDGIVKTYGFCAVWTTFYIDLVLSNPTINRQKLIKGALNTLSDSGSFRAFITNYEKFFKTMFNKLEKYDDKKLKSKKAFKEFL